MIPLSRTALLYSSLAALLILPACSNEAPHKIAERAPGQFEKAETAEDLLQARGVWKIVEEAREPSPLQLHASARDQVNPDNMRIVQSHLKNPVDIKDGQEVHYRQLRLELGRSARGDSVDRLLPAKSDLIVTETQLTQTLLDLEQDRIAQARAAEREKQRIAQERREAAQIASIEPAAPGFTNAVTRMRYGHYPDKSRVVLDLQDTAKFQVTMQDDRTVRVVLQNSGWQAGGGGDINNHPLISSYAAQAGEEGTDLILRLKKPARIAVTEALSANETYPNPRIFFDLKPL